MYEISAIYVLSSEKSVTNDHTYSGARGVLEAYWKKLGGKPVRAPKAAATVSTSKKRGRASTTGEAKVTPRKEPKERKTPVPKRQRQSLARTTKEDKEEKVEVGQAAIDQAEEDKTPEPVPGYIEVGTDDWRPPKPTAGAWDKHIQAVDTIEKDDTGKLWAYLLWTQQNADGYFYRNKAKLETCYVACPQRVCPLFLSPFSPSIHHG